jgi:hypothetical protein
MIPVLPESLRLENAVKNLGALGPFPNELVSGELSGLEPLHPAVRAERSPVPAIAILGVLSYEISD